MRMKPHIIYEDEAIVVIDKDAGAIVHPAPGHESGAITDALVRRFPQMARVGSKERPGVVHRLDIETSGRSPRTSTFGASLNRTRPWGRPTWRSSTDAPGRSRGL